MSLAVLGAISSGFAVTSFAGGTVTTIFKLKQQLDKMQNVPGNIRSQLEYLDMFPALIAEMEEAFRQSREAYASLGTSQKCLDFLQKVLNIQNTTVQKLEADLASGSKVKRNKAKIKAVLKADTIQEHYQRLDMAIQMMNLCIHIYNTSLWRTQPDLIVAKLQATEKQQAVVEGPEAKGEQITGPPLQDHGRSTSSLLEWQSPSIFGSVRYASKTWASQYETQQMSLVRIQLPGWLACKTWDFYVEHAISGWHMVIRPISIIENVGDICRVIETGSSSDLLQTLSKRGYSLQDRTISGQTILSLTIWEDRFDIALDLVRAGASLSEPDASGRAPISDVCEYTTSSAARVQFFRQLAQWDKVEELVEVRLCSGLSRLALDYVMWNDVEIWDLLVSALSMEAPKPLWYVVPWLDVSGSTLLELFNRYEMMDLPDFSNSCVNVAPNDIAGFAYRFFDSVRFAPNTESGDGIESRDWRTLCRLFLRHVPCDRLSIPLPRQHVSPMVAAMNLAVRFSSSRLHLSHLKRLQLWLEDLQWCGIDLLAYGKAEKQLLISRGQHRQPFEDDIDGTCYFMPEVLDLDYGSSPKDWVIYWDVFGLDYAREFWQLIDPEPFAIPGSWVDD